MKQKHSPYIGAARSELLGRFYAGAATAGEQERLRRELLNDAPPEADAVNTVDDADARLARVLLSPPGFDMPEAVEDALARQLEALREASEEGDAIVRRRRAALLWRRAGIAAAACALLFIGATALLHPGIGTPGGSRSAQESRTLARIAAEQTMAADRSRDTSVMAVTPPVRTPVAEAGAPARRRPRAAVPAAAAPPPEPQTAPQATVLTEQQAYAVLEETFDMIDMQFVDIYDGLTDACFMIEESDPE